MISLDFTSFQQHKDLSKYEDKKEKIKDLLTNSHEMLDWYDIDKCIIEEEIIKIETLSETIRKECDVFLVIGIGGSFLGAKAVIEALGTYFTSNKPEIIFAGNNLSEEYLNKLLDYIRDKNVVLNVISKSGDTLETKIAFNILYKFIKSKYNQEEIKKRIIVTTDATNGSLRWFANENNLVSLNIPKQIGGRFSVLTTVGLLPIAVAGYNIRKLLSGARKNNYDSAFKYACVRDYLYNHGKVVESFTYYEPKLSSFSEWLKQLFGESQGKNKKGILPISCFNTQDLHSLGQFYQDGNPIIFETIIGLKQKGILPSSINNYMVSDINSLAVEKVAQAHLLAGIDSNIIYLDSLNEENLGELIYFFELAAAIGGYLLDVNPFDQPGVNEYKRLLNEALK